MKNRSWSIWLNPCQKDRIKYHRIIYRNCKLYSNPIFEPHVTLFGRVDIAPYAFVEHIKELSLHQERFILNTKGISLGLPPWKSLFIRLQGTKRLKKFQSGINQYLKKYKKYTFDPHLSLFYGKKKIKKTEIKGISVGETIEFSSVSLLYTSDRIDDWNVIEEFNLK